MSHCPVAMAIAGKTRADCLEGHLGDFRISARLYARGLEYSCVRDERFTSATDHVECDTRCYCSVDAPCTLCLGSTADFNVSTSANGFVITTHAMVRPVEPWSIGDDLAAWAGVRVEATVLDGPVRCTYDGANKSVYAGVETSWALHRDNITGSPGMPLNLLFLEEWQNWCQATAVGVPGEVTCTLTVSCTPDVYTSTRSWINPSGGSYNVASNWSTDCVPAHDAQRSDMALFALANTEFIPVSGSGATAGQWFVTNGCPIAFSGSGQVFSTSTTNPSLRILGGGQLRLVSGASLDSVHAAVGTSGATNSVLEVKGGWWTNAESAKIGRGSVDVLDGGTASTKVLTIGSGNGPGAVHVTGDASSFDVSGEPNTIGKTTAGTLEIDKGIFSFTSLVNDPAIGESAPGTVTVRGDDSSPGSRGIFQVRTSLWIGVLASGRLNIQRGGSALIGKDIFLNFFGGAPDSALLVDGQGGSAFLSISGALHVGATQQVGVLVDNGGVISAQGLKVGWNGGTGTADCTIRGRQTAPNMPSRLWVTDQPGDPGPVENAIVGASAPGQLNIQAGASADLEGGLTVGESAPGTVTVSGLNAPPSTFSTLTVTGETRVGIGAAGIVQLDEGAIMENDGDLTIGLGGGHPSGSVTVDNAALLFVHGTLSVGASGGEGLLEIGDHSGVACDTLLVGGNTLQAGGTIILQDDFAELFVSGNVQVGVSVGSGLIEIDDECVLRLNGPMTIGNPNRSPYGHGKVSLNDATIEGTDIILVNRNGRLEGTGRVAAPALNAGGYIAPGLSPGTLTIEGDYEQLPTGVLVIEYAGLNPGEFDVLHVTGQTTLGGRLEVHFRGGFSPADPAAFVQSQDFVEADQGITGDYDQRIYAFPDLFADFDDDGDKDLEDVAAFQNCFGLSGAELGPACVPADWENDGVIGGREIQELGARLTGP